MTMINDGWIPMLDITPTGEATAKRMNPSIKLNKPLEMGWRGGKMVIRNARSKKNKKSKRNGNMTDFCWK